MPSPSAAFTIAQGPAGPVGATGPARRYFPRRTARSCPTLEHDSVAFDINGNPVPFGHHELLGAYTITNSEGLVAMVGGFVNMMFLKSGEAVNRQPIMIHAMSTLYFLTAGCTGDTGYVSGSSIIYNAGHAIATLDAPAVINTEVTFSFWRYDMTKAPTLDVNPVSMRSGNGSCQNNPPPLTSAIEMIRSDT